MLKIFVVIFLIGTTMSIIIQAIVHFGDADETLKNRHNILLQAYEKNPARFNKKIPTIKKLKPVYINPPKYTEEKY